VTVFSNASTTGTTSENADTGLPVAPVVKRAKPGTPGPVGFLSRQHILDATEACFVESGYDKTTIRAIASRLGCSVGSIYRYFEDKRDLLLACASRVLTPVIDGLKDDDSIEVSVHRYLRCASERDELYRLLFWLACVSDRSDSVPTVISEVIDGWETITRKRGVAEHLWTLLHGLIMLGVDRDEILLRVLGDATPPASLRASGNGDAKPADVAPDAPAASADDDEPIESTSQPEIEPEPMPYVDPTPAHQFSSMPARETIDDEDFSDVEIVQPPATKWVEVEQPNVAKLDNASVGGEPPAPIDKREDEGGGEGAGGNEDMTLL